MLSLYLKTRKQFNAPVIKIVSRVFHLFNYHILVAHAVSDDQMITV